VREANGVRNVAIGVALALACAALGASSATADSEPNGAVFMAEGPIAGGQEIRGTLDGGDRDDWYVFHVEGVHQLHLTGGQTLPGETPVNPTGSDPFSQPLTVAACANVELTDARGKPIPRDFTSGEGTSTFYVHASLPAFGGCSHTTAYEFRVEPAAAVVTGPGKLAIKGTGEPNDSRATAGGPLAAGAWYHSELETANDRDWLRFYVRPGRHDVDVQAVVYGTDCPSHRVELQSSRGADLGGYVGSGATISSFGHRFRGAGARLYVAIRSGQDGTSPDCVRSATVVQVGPEDAIMPGADVREACADGRAAERRAGRAAKAARRALTRAKADGRATKTPRRKLERNRAALRKAGARMAAYCSR
jgi:hypothetical protein